MDSSSPAARPLSSAAGRARMGESRAGGSHDRRRAGDQPQGGRAPRRPDQLYAEIAKVIVGQRMLIDRLLVGLLTGGHLLLEGVPGLAKTLAVGRRPRPGLSFSRIQFTPDLLPADVIGTQIYNPRTGEFNVNKGPVFAQVVLADEINRAPAKVQSALLEAMQERQVTIGDASHLPNSRSSCWRRRTRSSRKAPTRCPRRRRTVHVQIEGHISE